MRKTMKRITAVCALLAPFAIAGCATHLELDEVKKDLAKQLNQVKAEASAAKAEAAAASSRADASSKAAEDVSRKADRMYKESLRK